MNVLLSSPLGALLAQPWVDPAGLFGAERWYLPLSRLWAAANAAGEDVALFREQVGALPALLAAGRPLAPACSAATRGCGRPRPHAQDWEDAIFDCAGRRLRSRRARPAAGGGGDPPSRRRAPAFYPLLFRPPLRRRRAGGSIRR